MVDSHNISKQRAVNKRMQYIYAILFVCLGLVIFLVGAYSFLNYRAAYISNIERGLKTIVQMKSNELLYWKNERIKDLQYFRSNPDLIRNLSHLIDNPKDPLPQQYLHELLDQFQKNHQYHIWFANLEGEVIYTLPSHPDPVLLDVGLEALSHPDRQKIYYFDFCHFMADEDTRICLIAAVYSDTLSNQPFAWMVLQQSPLYQLNKMIQRSEIAGMELFLMRMQDQHVRVVSPEGVIFNGTYVEMQEHPQSVFYQALSGKVGVFRAKDLTGSSLLTFVSPVAEENWYLISAVDYQSVMKVLRDRFVILSLLVGSVILSLFLLAFYLWKRQRMKLYEESEQRFRSLANSGRALIYTTNKLMHRDYVNDIWLDFSGRSLKQETSEKWLDIVHPDDRERYLGYLQEAQSRFAHFLMQYRMQRHDGVFRWFFEDASPRFDSKGAFVGYVGHCLDITTSKEAEEKLRQNELLLQDVVRTQPIALYRFRIPEGFEFSADKLGLIRGEYISEQVEQYIGISRAEFMTNPFSVVQNIHPEDLHGFIETNRLAIMNCERFRWEGRVLVKGQLKWILMESLPHLTLEGDVVWSGAALDISVQKLLEQQLIRREGLERLLAELSAEFVNVSPDRLDEALTGALAQLGLFCNADRAYVFLADLPNQQVSNTHEWCAKGVAPQMEKLQQIPCTVIPEFMKALRSGEPLVICDVNALSANWEIEKNILEPQGVKSLLVAPIISQKKLMGFVGFDVVNSYRVWEDYEAQSLNVFSDLVYNALESKKSEEALMESKKMLRTIMDTINVRVFWKDVDLHYLGCNMAYAQDMGLQHPDQIAGLDDFCFFEPEKANLYRADDQEVMQSKVPRINFEVKRIDRQRGERWLRLSKIPLLDATGELIGLLGSYEDITLARQAQEALKSSEEHYRLLTEHIFDGVYTLTEGRLTYVNQSFCTLLGFTTEELLSADFEMETLFTPQTNDLIMARREARKQGMPLDNMYQVQLIRKDGQVRDMEISTTVIQQQEPMVVLGVMRDITERIENQRLINEVSVARQSAQFKQNFLANMSHEIRTPLTGVMGMIDILADVALPEPHRDYVDTLRLSAENLREIINQILDYSKIEAGEVSLKPRIFRSRMIFENALRLFEANCQKKNIRIETSMDKRIPEFLSADDQRIGQVVNNLLSNAVKFTEKGKIMLVFKVQEVQDEGVLKLRIEVQDTGRGIAADIQGRLFRPFSQVDTEDTRHYEGTGLGLSISKELCRLLGGTIGVESVPDGGSNFWFTFLADQAKEQTDKQVLSQPVKSNRRLHVLLVEDKPVNQKVVSIMLGSLGHRVTLAMNGKEALDRYQQGVFDLILMDIQMPVMDGITATAALRKQYAQLPPIIGLSANAFEGDREKYMKLGMDEYITKPVKMEDFKNLVNRLDV